MLFSPLSVYHLGLPMNSFTSSTILSATPFSSTTEDRGRLRLGNPNGLHSAPSAVYITVRPSSCFKASSRAARTQNQSLRLQHIFEKFTKLLNEGKMNKTKSGCSYLLEVCWRIFAGLCPEQWRWRTPRAFQCASPPSAFLWSSPLWSTSCHTWKHKASVRDMNNYVLAWSMRGSHISSTLNVNCPKYSDRTKWCGCLDLDGSQTVYGLVHSHAACMRSLHSDAGCVWHV